MGVLLLRLLLSVAAVPGGPIGSAAPSTGPAAPTQVAEGPVTGLVVDASGAPVAATLRSGDETGPVAGRADDRGRFSIERADASTDLVVMAPGFAPVRVPVARTRGAEALRIVLRPATLAEQVTVTAGRRELRGADTPAAAAVLTSADLLSMAATTPDDALRYTPGFTLFRRSSSRAANPTTQGVTLRGLSASGASRTLVLANGVPLNDPFGGWVYWGRVPQAAIERIEVVRGASSDLYGADAVGGVIQIVSVDASRRRARASIEGGSLGTSRVSAFGSSDVRGIAFAVGAERFETDGASIVDVSQRGSIDTPAGVRHSSWIAQAGWRGSAVVSSVDARVQGFGERRANGTPLQDNDTNQHQGSVRAAGVAGGGVWQATWFRTGQTYDQAFTAVAAGRASESLTSRQRVPSELTGGSGDWLRTFGRATVMGGVELRRVEGATTETRYVSGRPQAPTIAGGRQLTSAGFAQVTLAPAPAWTLVAGARVDRWVSHNQVTDADRDETSPSGRVAVAWQASGAWSVRGSVYRAHRTPTLNELHRNFRVGDTLTVANDALAPERLTGGEASALWAAGRASARATLFATTLDEAVANVTLSTTPTLTTRQRQNAATVRSRGIEVEGEWRLDARWSVGGQATVTRAEFAGGAAGLDGLDVPQVPRYQAAVSARVADPRWVSASVQVRRVGRQFEDDRNTLVLDSGTVVDAYAGRTMWPGLHLFVAVENLFDEVLEVGRTPLLTVGLPRTTRVGARFAWK